MKPDIHHLVTETAKSVGRSFDYYWPSDEHGKNDPPEQNLSIHLAHVLLQKGYAVFAEVNHPDESVQGIDMLGITPDKEWFLACEIKKHLKSGMSESIKDLQRVAEFWLNENLTYERCGSEPIEVLKTCCGGIGLVAGLKWTGKQGDAPLKAALDRTTFGDVLNKIGGTIGDPILVRRYTGPAAPGAYYLQYAFFEIEKLQAQINLNSRRCQLLARPAYPRRLEAC